MNSEKYKKDNVFITLNLNKEKHAELIEWIKTTAEEDEQSLSSLCVKLLKRAMKLAKGDISNGQR